MANVLLLALLSLVADDVDLLALAVLDDLSLDSSIGTLPRGLYIMNGKKLLVK